MCVCFHSYHPYAVSNASSGLFMSNSLRDLNHLKLRGQTIFPFMLSWLLLFLHGCMLNNRDLRAMECHVASVYPCRDVGSELLAPHSHPKSNPLSLSLSLSLSLCVLTLAPSDWVGTHGWVNFVRSPSAILKFANGPLHVASRCILGSLSPRTTVCLFKSGIRAVKLCCLWIWILLGAPCVSSQPPKPKEQVHRFTGVHHKSLCFFTL